MGTVLERASRSAKFRKEKSALDGARFGVAVVHGAPMVRPWSLMVTHGALMVRSWEHAGRSMGGLWAAWALHGRLWTLPSAFKCALFIRKSFIKLKSIFGSGTSN